MPTIVYCIAFTMLCQKPIEILLSLKEVEETKCSICVEVVKIVEHIKVTDV